MLGGGPGPGSTTFWRLDFLLLLLSAQAGVILFKFKLNGSHILAWKIASAEDGTDE